MKAFHPRIPFVLFLAMLFSPACDELLSTGEEEEAPNAPLALMVQATTENVIEMSWTDQSDNEQGFRIEVQTSGSIIWNGIGDVGRNVTGYAWNQAEEATAYTFRVCAYNDVDDSEFAYSSQITIPVNAPSNLTATLAGEDVHLSWQDNSSCEIGHQIERAVGTEGYSILATIGEDITSYTDDAAPAGSDLMYRVSAYTEDLYSNTSNEATITTPAEPQIVFSEDFEGYESETFPPSPFSFYTSNDPVVTAFAWDFGSNTALVFCDREDAAYGWVDLAMQTISTGVIEMDLVMVDDVYDHDAFGIFLGFDDIYTGDNLAVRLEFLSTDAGTPSVYVVLGDGEIESFTFPALQWFELKIVWRMDTGFWVFINGTQLGGTFAFYEDNSGDGIGGLSVMLFSNQTLNWGYMDNIVITDGIPSGTLDANAEVPDFSELSRNTVPAQRKITIKRSDLERPVPVLPWRSR